MNLVQPSVRGKLRRLQTAIKARLAGEGIAWLILALIAAVFVTLALDYFLRLPRGLRAVISPAALALALYVLGRYTIMPLLVPLDHENLALLVERRYGQLKDRLISAIQFSRMPLESTFASQAMINHMAAEANELAEKIDFKGVVERRTLLQAMGLSGLGVVILTVFTLWQPAIMSLWWHRNVEIDQTLWPQDTYLSLPVHVTAPAGCNPKVTGEYYYRTDWNGSRLYMTDEFSLSAGASGWRITAASIPPNERSEPLFTHDILEGKYAPVNGKTTGSPVVTAAYKVLRGDNLTVKILADLNDGHFAPDQITVYTRYPSLADTTQEKVSQGGEEDKKNGKWMTYYKSYSVVNESFTFWVTGGDDSMDKDHPHAVVVIDPPSVTDANFHVVYPEYVNLRPQEFKGTQGGLAVRVGSKVTITAVTNKDIQSADMIYNGKMVGSMQVLNIDPKGERPRKLVGTFQVGTENKAAVGTLLIHLRDTEGYENNRPQQYLVQVQPDLPPTVDVKVRGVGNRISNRAVIPLFLSAKDDNGIAKATAIVTVTHKEGAATSQPASATATTAPVQFAPMIVNIPGPDPGHSPKEFKEVRADIDTLGFHAPSDSAKPGLVPGDKVTIVVQVADNMPAEFGGKDASGAFVPGPNKTQSGELEFQVVKDEDLQEEFNSRMSTALLDLIQIIKTQSDANTATASASAAADSSASAKQHLVDSLRLQVQVSADSAKVVSAVGSVDEEEVNDRVGTLQERERVKKILDMYTAAQVLITNQVVALNALGQVGDPAKFRQNAQTIMDAQQDISRKLEEIKSLFEDDVNQRYMATQVKVIIDWSQDLQNTLEHLRDMELNNSDAPVDKKDHK